MVSYHFDLISNSDDSALNWLPIRKQVNIYGFSQHDTVKEFVDEWSTVRSHTVQYSKTKERIHHSLNNTETVILIFSMVFHTSKTNVCSPHSHVMALPTFSVFYPILQLGNLPTLQNVAEFIIWQMLGRLKWRKKVLELHSESWVPKLVKNVNFLSNRIKDSGQRVKKFSKSRLN